MSPSAPVGVQASAAAVLRAAQKDVSFKQQLTASIADVIHRTLGSVHWVRHHENAQTATDLLYSALTTLSLRQTLGEEYTGILQVDSTSSSLPSAMARHVMVFLHCFGPPLLNYSIRRCESSLLSGFLRSYLRPELTALLLRHVGTARAGVTVLQRAHLALFYVQGLFYHLSKRVAGVKYVVIRRWLNDSSSRGSLRLLGRLLLLQLLLQATYSLYTAWRRGTGEGKGDHEEEGGQEGVQVPPSLQCSLCLGSRVHPTVCPCGHLYCWTCIHTALSSSGHQCPLCRYPVEPRQLVPLANYS